MKDDNLQGFVAISKREFLSNLMSPRMAILVVIFSLIVLLGSFGFATLGSMSLSGFVPEEDVYLSAFYLDDDDDGEVDDLVVYAMNPEGEPQYNVTVQVLFSDDMREPPYWLHTDKEGKAVLYNTTHLNFTFMVFSGSDFISLAGAVSTLGYLEVQHNSTSLVYVSDVQDLTKLSLTDTQEMMGIDDPGITPGFFVMTVDQDGNPRSGVTLNIVGGDENVEGKTNEYGFYINTELKNGDYLISLDSDDGSEYGEWVKVSYTKEEGLADLFKDKTSDEVLTSIASFVVMIATLSAVILAYDTIVRERQENSLDFLLCRPVHKGTILLAKFLGVLSAISLPFALVNLGAVAIIWQVNGSPPTGQLIAVFVLGVIGLVAIWILLEMIISTLVKSGSTANLAGIGLWFFFNILYDVVILLVSGDINNPDLETMIGYSYFNPNSCFTYLISYVQASSTEFASDFIDAGLNGYNHALAMGVWFVTLLMLAYLVFKKKIV